MHQLWGEMDRRLLIKLGTAGLTAFALPGAAQALGFFMYPQGETAQGRLDSLDPAHFAYRISSRKLA